MDAPRVIVETHLHGGLPGTTLVGVPETAVREARDRVKSALINCGYDYPDGRVVVNLAPVDLAKEGGRFDLAIAISILRASGQLRNEPDRAFDYEFLGELSLGGELRRIRGSLCAALGLNPEDRLIVPFENAAETRLSAGRVLPLAHLLDVIRVLGAASVPGNLTSWQSGPPRATVEPPLILGQSVAKRALAIAAAGGHHLLMVGPPGTGKSLLASRLPVLLPTLNEQQAMEVAAVYSAAGSDLQDPEVPPFRNPHHSISSVAMIGGSAQPRPGEISLAHHGVLFLDELPHFKPSALDSLREPLETREINIARVSGRARFPACFQLLAAMNPCPSGLVCSESSCRCRPDQVRRYQSRISGPLLDRIDLHVGLGEVPRELLLDPGKYSQDGEPGADDVCRARERQQQRQGNLNAHLSVAALNDQVPLRSEEKHLLSRAAEQYRLSARGFHRVLRVARSVADLEGEARVGNRQLMEALSYRAMDWSVPF